MKRLIFYFVALLSISFLFSSCEKEEDFDETLLIGKWQSGTVYEKYLSNYDGYTWDTSDDVTEAEAQKFTWTLVKADLTQIHIMEIGGNVTRFYTVIELTATTLKYEDRNANPVKTYTFTKISK